MPSVQQGQRMRTLLEQWLSVVSWIKFRNVRLGQLLFKLVPSPTCLWSKSHFLGSHTWEDLECALCHYQPKDHCQLLQHVLVRAKGNAGRSYLVWICGKWILHNSFYRSYIKWMNHKSPNASQTRLSEQNWEEKLPFFLSSPCFYPSWWRQ